MMRGRLSQILVPVVILPLFGCAPSIDVSDHSANQISVTSPPNPANRADPATMVELSALNPIGAEPLAGPTMPTPGALPFVPFCYHWLFVAGRASATPGQQALGLVVRRNDDLGPPSFAQAFVYTLVFYLTLASLGWLLVIALFTVRHRTLHDLASGLVVVRARALTAAFGSWNMPGGSPYA